ncbi:hypothetical protein SAMN02990966_01920 [Rhodospirillales bacterium URHD0017]|nr:hypothetical protein SAMN02990966_01920 [Rhodospirillales bacterium URHD0017]
MEIHASHSGLDRDSRLTPRGARAFDLILQYRMELVRCEPTTHFNASAASRVFGTGDGLLHDGARRFHLERWENDEWLAYRENFARVILRYWDRTLELAPNRPWYQRPGTQDAPEAARITCGLALTLVDTAAQAHQRYFIIKPRETNFRPFANAQRRVGLFTHRDLAMRRQIWLTPIDGAVHNVLFMQSPVLHEFGHTLGLGHIGGHGSGEWAYGASLAEQQDIMGLGNRLSAGAARPWIAQLSHHVIRARAEPPLSFSARVIAPQLVSYWDYDWVPEWRRRPATASGP